MAYSSGVRLTGLIIPADSHIVAACERSRHAHDRDYEEESEADRSWLARLDVELVVPMVATAGSVSGLLMLGARKSEEPYGGRDKELLLAIATQLAVVAENLRLKERVDEERQKRERVIHRLEGRSINLLKECPQCGSCYDGSATRCADDGHDLGISLRVHRLIDSQYRLDRLIGKGGMGVVHEAEDMRLRRKWRSSS